MKVELNGERYRITFAYDDYGVSWGRRTVCGVERDSGIDNVDGRRIWKSVGVGYTICGPSDIFCKDAGRKIALARALLVAGFTRDERRCFWYAYHSRALAANLARLPAEAVHA